MGTKIGIEILGGYASEGYKRCKSYLSRRWWWIRDREYYIWKDLKKGVWVLYGKKDGIYECLNVGKSINVGSEILYDIACLKFLGYEENNNANLKYINQFAEFKDFNYESKMTQEYLYPYISKTYKALVFIYVWNKKIIRWLFSNHNAI